ncbi:unnamed protein product [marine sediment metagenome]|uniref:Uncharacterized protein n=1 Tax=marine sediment metagenome TaxID=412755 RepID=X1J8A5_9ZZZZ
MKLRCPIGKEGTVAKQGKDKQLNRQSDNDQPPKSQPKRGEIRDPPSTQVSQNHAYEDRTDE